jgi:hypothetical protein
MQLIIIQLPNSPYIPLNILIQLLQYPISENIKLNSWQMNACWFRFLMSRYPLHCVSAGFFVVYVSLKNQSEKLLADQTFVRRQRKPTHYYDPRKDRLVRRRRL